MIVVLLFISIVSGFCVGILSGLTPGIHVNVIASLMVAIYASSPQSSELRLPIAVFIVSVSITHAFFDYIPSLFLGVPTDEVYTLLPGQRMIKQGEGGKALRLSIEGSWKGLLFSLTIAIIFIILAVLNLNLLSTVDKLLKPFLFWVLLAISVFLIKDESRTAWATTIFLLSGFFGIVVLGTPLIPNGSSAAFNSLFPALSGLFGISGLLISLADEKGKLPIQKQDISLCISNRDVNAASLLGTISGMAVGLLPGLGSANASTLALKLTGDQNEDSNDKFYITTTSAIQTSDALFGITALYFIQKSRSGASVAIGALIEKINPWETLTIVLAMGLAGFASRMLLLNSWQIFLKIINNLNYRALTFAVITFITLLVSLTTGFWGVMVLVAATSLGLLPPMVNVRRSQMMGFFLIPVMLFFSGFQESFVSLFRLESQLSPSIPTNLQSIAISLGICFFTSLIIYVSTSFIQKKK
jgi:putative membrane protein